MIMGNDNKSNINPYGKVRFLRGFNNTTDNIRVQMDSSKNVVSKREKKASEAMKPSYNPSKQRDNMAKLNRMNRWK